MGNQIPSTVAITNESILLNSFDTQASHLKANFRQIESLGINYAALGSVATLGWEMFSDITTMTAISSSLYPSRGLTTRDSKRTNGHVVSEELGVPLGSHARQFRYARLVRPKIG